MIIDSLERSELYVPVHPGFQAAFTFLHDIDTASLKNDRIPIDGERLYVTVFRGKGKGRAAAHLETHDKYIDIQYTFAGTEEVGWAARSRCRASSEGYDAGKDIEFYADRPDFWLPIHHGCFAVFLPTDAHAPLATEGHVSKIVVKVAVEWQK